MGSLIHLYTTIMPIIFIKKKKNLCTLYKEKITIDLLINYKPLTKKRKKKKKNQL